MIRASIVITLLALAGFVHFVAQAREGRLFLVPLGRPLSDVDHRRMLRLRVVNALAVVSAAVVLFTVDSEAVVLAAVLGGALVPSIALVVELVLATKDGPRPRVPSRFVVPLTDARPPLSALISPPLWLASAAILAGGLAAFLALYPSLPAEVPMHWNLRCSTGWSRRGCSRCSGGSRPRSAGCCPSKGASATPSSRSRSGSGRCVCSRC
ncbi:DUF1648 domain-containing protein [Myxococcota bacterium]|nr:DUF1648 domain-containing protein [Myxococcota bacterium]